MPDYFYTGAYIRLSRADCDREESDSVANQKKLLADYIKKHKELLLYNMYVDDGYSGITFQRPGFQQMIADIENKKISCVIVKDLSRFGRDYIETGRFLERYFPQRGIRFISVSDHIDQVLNIGGTDGISNEIDFRSLSDLFAHTVIEAVP